LGVFYIFVARTKVACMYAPNFWDIPELAYSTLFYCSCNELSDPSEPDPIALALHCQKVPDGSV
jgi:hypothetical protein